MSFAEWGALGPSAVYQFRTTVGLIAVSRKLAEAGEDVLVEDAADTAPGS